MNSNIESKQYRFADFYIRNDQQVLYRQHKKIPLGTKVYYLLLTFVENPGKILSKDEIIEAVWPGQVVTDTALAKQILRLRKLLGDDNSEHPFIETHRGVGYRFTASVETQSTLHLAFPTRQPRRPAWLIYAALAIILLAIPFFRQLSDQPGEDKEDFQQAGLPISLAIVPTTSRDDWLNTGGLDYLAELLGQHDLIYTLGPDAEWYASSSPEKLAIGLTTNQKFDYSFLIGLEESDGGFIATTRLRTEDDILASAEIQAASLPALFKKIDKWVSLNLSIRDQLDTIDANVPLTTDQFALQSYLQGIFEVEVSGDNKRALSYFQSAVNKDEEFLVAWIRLAAAHLDVGGFDRAIAIANTQIERLNDSDSPKALIDFNFIKAMAYYRLRDDERSTLAIRQSINAIDQSGDPYVKLAGLKSLIFLANMQNDWEEAETLTLESLTLSKEYYPLPNHLAGLNLSLARIKLLDKQAQEARQYLSTAINFYQQSENSNGMISSLCVLNRLNLQRNMLDDGVQVATRAEPWLQNSTSLHEQACFIQATGTILNLRGYFDRSQIYIDRMRAIGLETKSDFYPFLAEFLTVHRLYVQGKFQQAAEHMEIMRTSIVEKSALPSVRFGFYALDILVSSRAMPAAEALQKIDNTLQKYPALKEYFTSEILRAQGHVTIKSGQVEEGLKMLQLAEAKYREQQEVAIANYVAFEALETLLQTPGLDYKDTLDRLEANTQYDYLFFKLKAQFLAREDKFLNAAMLMQENKLKANQLWSPEDQLLLEQYQGNSL